MTRRSSFASGAALVICATAVACSDTTASFDEPQSRRPMPVVGGEPAEADDYPSTVALVDPTGEPFCTGTLVAPTVVLSAAHCLQSWWGDPISTSEVRIVYGYTDPSSAPSSDRLSVASVTPHPDYDPWASTDSDGMGHQNDIGVVVLDEPIAGGVVSPILPSGSIPATLVQGADVHVVGYGVTSLSTYASGILYKAVTPFMRHIQWEMLAGSPGNPDSCNGDSGGPAYMVSGGNLYLVGVTSRAWAQSQQSCGDGGIYTLAPSYVAWIESVAGELDGGVLDGGWDVVQDVATLDADPACLPVTSPCHPITNEGCDTSAEEACQRGSNGQFACHPAPNDAQPGDLCDQTDRFCVQGFHCADSLRCERYCCSDADCPSGGPCEPLSPSGTLGTCGLEPEDAGTDAQTDTGTGGAAGAGGSGGEGGAGGAETGGSAGSGGSGGTADAGVDAQRSDPGSDVDGDDDGGCGCRTAGSSRSGGGLTLLFALGLVGARLRRRFFG